MKLTSREFKHMQKIPLKFTGDGEDISPSLNISESPENTKSFVLIVEDPDAPSGSWIHWLVWNIPFEMKKIQENSIPGIQGKNSWGKNSYGGPKPPFGTHRYFFKIYALDTFLDLKESRGKQEIEESIQGHILGKAELVGLYR